MEEQISKSIKSIGSKSFYTELASLLSYVIDFDNLIAMSWLGQARPTVIHTLYRGPNVFRRLEKDYLASAYQLDPFYHLHISGSNEGMYKLLDIAPDNFSRSKYYQWYYGDLGISDEITLFCPVKHEVTITISIGLSGVVGKKFSQKSTKKLQQQEPVLLALIEAHEATMSWNSPQDTIKLELSDRLMRQMIETHAIKLSSRQCQIAVLILQGHSSESAALQLDISPQTVKVFRKQLYKRCQISSQAELFSLMMPLLEVR